MKRALKFLGVFGLVVAFTLVGVAMALPHRHTADTPHHVCWLCQAKGVAVAPPQADPEIGPTTWAVSDSVSESRCFYPHSTVLLKETRAPPVVA